MKILIIAHKPPFPTIDGGCVAVRNFLQNVIPQKEIASIDHFSLSTHKHPFDKTKFPTDWSKVQFLHQKIDTSLNPVSALRALLTGQSYNLSRFYSEAVALTLRKLQAKNQYDVVFFETPFSAVYAPFFEKSKRILRAHNLEFEIWNNLSKNEKNSLKRWYLKQLAKALEKEEKTIFQQMDVIATLSIEDEQKLKKITTTKIVHIPVSATLQKLIEPTEAPAFCFLGIMDWAPNIEAVNWFLDSIFPEILLKIPQATFHIAGKYSEKIKAWQNRKNVLVHGFVPNLATFMQNTGIFVAPLLSGSGVKIKVMEAMSFGVPCVLTPKGAEGLFLPSNYTISLDKESFVQQCIELFESIEKRFELGELGWQTMKSFYATEKVQDALKYLLKTEIPTVFLSNNP